MIDTQPVILSYNDILNKLISLAKGTYIKKDAYSKWFYSLFANKKIIKEEFESLCWDKEDIKQELYLCWHKAVLNFYNVGNKNRRDRASLGKILFNVGGLHLAYLIKKELGGDYYIEQPVEYVFDEESIIFSDIFPQNFLNKPFFSCMKELSPTCRLFLYRFLIEDSIISELIEDFGGNWYQIKKILNEIKEVLY